MMIDPDVLIAEFGDAAAKAGIHGWPCRIRSEKRPAPHEKPVLPPGEGAVYVFAIGSAYGSSAPCGPAALRRSSRSARSGRTTGRNYLNRLSLLKLAT